MEARPQRRIPAAFTTAGGLMSAGTLLLVLSAAGRRTDVNPQLEALPFVLLWLAVVAVAVGLLEVISKLRGHMRSVTRVGAAAVSIIGAVAALSMTVTSLLVGFEPVQVMASGVMLVVFVSFYVMLASLLVASIVVGVAAWRAGLGRPAAGPLLVTGGLLTLLVPIWLLVHHAVLEWLWVAVVGGLAVIFFAVGAAVRAGESHSIPGRSGPGSLGTNPRVAVAPAVPQAATYDPARCPVDTSMRPQGPRRCTSSDTTSPRCPA